MKTIAIVIGALTCMSCASAPVPTQRYANANAAVRSAEVINADGVPAAALHLRMARDQLARGQRLIKDGDNEEAGRVLMRAEADAQTAVEIAREARAKQEAAQALEQVKQAQAQAQMQQMQQQPEGR